MYATNSAYTGNRGPAELSLRRSDRSDTAEAASAIQRIALAIIALLAAILFSRTVSAQAPIEIQRKAADGDYFQALVLHEKMPKRRATTAETIAAARSAWALSLPDRAKSEYDKALSDESLGPVERARIYLAKGIIEFQEGRFQIAGLFAEKAVGLLDEPAPLRGNGWLLWAEALASLGSLTDAEVKYLRALEEALPSDGGEIHFLLGRCRMKLGKLEEARGDFEAVPLNHERTPAAVRSLAELAFDQGKWDHAVYWLAKGREEYPDEFLDSWVDFALLTAAARTGNGKMVREIRAAAENKYPPSDGWLTLLRAAAERFEWDESVAGQRGSLGRTNGEEGK